MPCQVLSAAWRPSTTFMTAPASPPKCSRMPLGACSSLNCHLIRAKRRSEVRSALRCLSIERACPLPYRGELERPPNAGRLAPSRRNSPAAGRLVLCRNQASPAPSRFGPAERVCWGPRGAHVGFPSAERDETPCAPRRAALTFARLRSSDFRARMAAMRAAIGIYSRSAGRFA